MKLQFKGFLPIVFTMSACTVGDDYVAPEIELASSFAESGNTSIGDVSAHKWWLQYQDPILNKLVSKGLAQNLGIRASLSRVEEAQAVASATGLPALITGDVSARSVRSGGTSISTTTTEGVTFDPELVIDLFGGERRAREEALSRLQAAELDIGTARLAFLSALVTSYIDLRYFQESIAVSRQTVASRRSSLSLVRQQREARVSTELDVLRAEAALDEALAEIPAFERGFDASLYAIATLIAEPAQNIGDLLKRGAAQPFPRNAVGAGVPADLLRNRPDIRAAERQYAAAVASVGVSEAAMYPSLTLGGAVAAFDNTTWTFGPAITLPLLNQGVLNANRRAAVARAKQAELAWRVSVLAAVEEVQVASSTYNRALSAAAAIRKSAASYGRLVQLSEQTFQSGTTTLFEILENQRSLADANLNLAAANRELAAAWARLQVAGGRGWAIQ